MSTVQPRARPVITGIQSRRPRGRRPRPAPAGRRVRPSRAPLAGRWSLIRDRPVAPGLDLGGLVGPQPACPLRGVGLVHRQQRLVDRQVDYCCRHQWFQAVRPSSRLISSLEAATPLESGDSCRGRDEERKFRSNYLSNHTFVHIQINIPLVQLVLGLDNIPIRTWAERCFHTVSRGLILRLQITTIRTIFIPPR